MNEKASVQGYDISQNSAAVIGCGGLGTNVAVHLAGAGIGKLWLCDFDVIQSRNLNRQFFYTPQEIGLAKCGVLAKKLSSFSPDTTIIPVQKQIRFVQDLTFACDADIIILAVDNIDTRRIVNDYCSEVKKPLINGGVDRSFGTAYLYVPGSTADLEEAGVLNPPTHFPLSQSPTVGIIGALEAKLATDYFLKQAYAQGHLLCFDGMEIHALRIHKHKGDEAF